MANEKEFFEKVNDAAVRKIGIYGPLDVQLGEPVGSEDPQGEADLVDSSGTPYRVVLTMVVHRLVPFDTLEEEDGGA